MTDQRRLSVSTGPLAPADLVLSLGPAHPASHGVLRLSLVLDGDRIASAEPEVGLLHRGAEKLYEVRDYRQVLVLANRHDWLGAFTAELGVARAVEQMLGMEVPERAVWARTTLAEITRAQSHLVFLGAYPLEGDEGELARRAYALRELLLQVLEEATGGRVHVMANRVGGLKEDLPEGWTGRARVAAAQVRAGLPGVAARLLDDEAFRRSAEGVGVLTPATVLAYGVSGAPARASGVALDLRTTDPAYASLLADGVLRVPVRGTGDVLARMQVLAEQTEVALDLVDACLDRLDTMPSAPVNLRLPQTLKAPEGHTYAWVEGPLGINGWYLVSRGGKTPWRLKLRTASFNTVQALREVLPGAPLADLVPVLASTFFVVGDVDK